MNRTRADAERNIESLYGWPTTWPPMSLMDDDSLLRVAGEQIDADNYGRRWNWEDSWAGRHLAMRPAPAPEAAALELIQPGMTTREHFAMAALQGVVAGNPGILPSEAAGLAVAHADALIAVLDGEQ